MRIQGSAVSLYAPSKWQKLNTVKLMQLIEQYSCFRFLKYSVQSLWLQPSNVQNLTCYEKPRILSSSATIEWLAQSIEIKETCLQYPINSLTHPLFEAHVSEKIVSKRDGEFR